MTDTAEVLVFPGEAGSIEHPSPDLLAFNALYELWRSSEDLLTLAEADPRAVAHVKMLNADRAVQGIQHVLRVTMHNLASIEAIVQNQYALHPRGPLAAGVKRGVQNV